MKVNLAHLIPLLLFSASISAWAADPTPVQVVTRLYCDFAWEALIEEPTPAGDTLIDQPKAVLERYLDDNLTALILKDRECVRRTHEVCRLDFVPIWASQDPGGTSGLHVSSSRDKPAIVNVRFRYVDGQMANLRFDMVKTPRGWRVADVEYPAEPSLLKQLTSR
jgi:hypothetical protein